MGIVSDVRPSPIAGLWYSDDSKELSQQIDRFLQSVPPAAIQGKIVGLIVPHAGLRYSGRTASYAFSTVLRHQYDLVTVISPMHDYHPAPFLTTAHRAYQTPLGQIPVDHQTLQFLDQKVSSRYNTPLVPLVADQEHSLEIELPFLQRALQQTFQLLPIMVRTHNPSILRGLADALVEALKGKNALLVASTDLSHFYAEPKARKLDQEMLRRIENMDPMAVLSAQNEGKGFACGAPAVAILLWAARQLGADVAAIMHQTTSAEESGDVSSVVGYGSAVIYQRELS